MGACLECGKEKNLTIHGYCWKCQIQGVSAPRGCGSCASKKTQTTVHQQNGQTVITRTDRRK